LAIFKYFVLELPGAIFKSFLWELPGRNILIFFAEITQEQSFNIFFVDGQGNAAKGS